jgi:selenocysteine-specific elongation factor
MRVIGTAGHVDHGKSTLIAALTGVHPDRLKEEQEREMTIDLGFGWLNLPNGEEVGIVDVPGHRDFIENMLAGVGGIDAALLIVAADEGIMPQTREHLAILDLLQIPSSLVVLTKIDLVSDPDWLDLVEADIRKAVMGTILEGADCVRVSAKNKVGLDELIAKLSQILEQKPPRPDLGRPRLPIDRVFSMSGFGTVVTGTLSDGQLRLGDEVEILPPKLKGRVRGLQTHKKKEEVAVPGSRTAVNISGVAKEQLQRGQVLTHPGQYQSTRRLDARLRLLSDVNGALKHASEVKVFIGASESIAKLRLLGVETLEPGEEGWIQLELRQPVVAVRGDHYILRRPSPPETLGGGTVIDHQPGDRHKRFDQTLLKKLASLSRGTPSEVLLEASLASGPAPIKEVVTRSRLEASQAKAALDELLAQGQMVTLEAREAMPSNDLLVMATSQWQSLRERMIQMVEAYHRNHPLRHGIPREELKSRVKLPTRPFNALVKQAGAEGLLKEAGSAVALPGYQIHFDSKQQAQVQTLMRCFGETPYAPPTVKECQAEVGEELFNALIELNELVSVSPEVVFRRQDYQTMIERIQGFILEHGQITVAEGRDLFNTSRRYILPLLEHLDAHGVTVREGDFRRLKK